MGLQRLVFLTILILLCFLFHPWPHSFAFGQRGEKADEKQEQQKPDWKDRLFVGGNMGLQFGDITFINASPVLGYRLSNDRSVAVGGIYQYIRNNRIDASSSLYGGRAWFRQVLFQGIFFQTEYQSINHRIRDPVSFGDRRVFTSALFVGGGYRSRIGANSYIALTVLWDVLGQRQPSPFPQPNIRGGVSIGL